MRLITKIHLGIGFFLLLLSFAIFASYRQLNHVDHYRNQAVQSQNKFLASAEFRGKVRNRFLETYVLLMTDGADSTARLFAIDEAAQLKKEELQKSFLASGDSESLREVFDAYTAIDEKLDQIGPLILYQKMDQVKAILRQAHIENFNKDFLPKIADSIRLGELAHARDAQILKESLSDLQIILLSCGVFGIVFSLIVGWMMSRTFASGMGMLEAVTQEISKGNFDVKMPITGPGELRILLQGLNSMSAALSEARTQLISQQQQLMVASKLSSLGEMAAGVAHEINNPLAIIRLRAEQMEDFIHTGKIDPKLFLEKLASVNNTVQRISKIVKGLRVLAREGSHDPMQSQSILELVEETLSFCRERFQHNGVELRVILDPTFSQPPVAECRSTELQQVLLNLLNNAYDAVEVLAVKWIDIEIKSQGHEIELSVTDSGEGIPPAIREKMMQPFFTTKEVGKGTGLGLSISGGIMHAHQGRLILDTKSPNTKFSLFFPRLQ